MICIFQYTTTIFVIFCVQSLSSQKHPHVIFEARTKSNKGCANTGSLERRMTGVRRQKHISGFRLDDVGEQQANGAGRLKRDVREATKYIETALVIDRAMFEKRNGSTRAEIVHDAIQVANIADLVSVSAHLSRMQLANFTCLQQIRRPFRKLNRQNAHRWKWTTGDVGYKLDAGLEGKCHGQTSHRTNGF